MWICACSCCCVCFSLPLPWLIYSFIHGLVPVAVSSNGLFCAIVLLFLMLLFVIISIASCKWKMNKTLGFTMFLLYFIFLVLSVMLEDRIIVCPVSIWRLRYTMRSLSAYSSSVCCTYCKTLRIHAGFTLSWVYYLKPFQWYVWEDFCSNLKLFRKTGKTCFQLNVPLITRRHQEHNLFIKNITYHAHYKKEMLSHTHHWHESRNMTLSDPPTHTHTLYFETYFTILHEGIST